MLKNSARALKTLNSNYLTSNKAKNKFKNKFTPNNLNYMKLKTCKILKKVKLHKSPKASNNFKLKLKLKKPN